MFLPSSFSSQSLSSNFHRFNISPIHTEATSRIHLSQDRDEIFITVAEYDSDYIAYLTKKSADQSPPSLLTMHQLGPWNVRSQSDMSQLGPILLAITLYADQEVRKARRS